MVKQFTTSAALVRRPFDVPQTTARLLRAAGVEVRAPEEVGGLLFGCIAHLIAGVYSQYPEHWPTFRACFLEASDDLRDILTSANPVDTVAGIRARQQRDRKALAQQQGVGRGA